MRLGVARIGLLLWILWLTAAIAAAAPEDWEGRPIRAIDFQPTLQPYAREYLLEIIPVRLGQPLHLTDVRAAIERLYRTGRYAGIHVDARAEEGGVALTFITRGNYFVGRLSVTGAAQPPGENVLVNATRLELGTLYAEPAGTEAVNNLQQVLRSNGFYRSTIRPEYHFDPETQQVAIRFVIESGERARYIQPLITGKPERPEHEIVETTHWKGWLGWKKVTDTRTQDGVQRVRRYYQKRDRLESRVALDKLDWKQDTNRVQPTLDVDAGPTIGVSVTGAKISRGKLKQLVPVFEEQSVDRDLLVEGATNLREYMESQGFFHAQVDFSSRTAQGSATDGAAASREIIEYRIDRGERHKIALVAIRGNRYFDEATLRERLYLRAASLVQFRYGRFSETFVRHDVDAITAVYRSNGFRDVEVTSRVEQNFKGKKNDIAVYLEINEGPQWLVAGLDVEGPSEENREAVLELIQSQQGQPFSDSSVAIDRDNILDYYFNHGHVGAAFTSSFSPDKEPHRVNVTYTITEGRQRFLRDFLISGLSATDPDLVRARLMLAEGEPLSRSRMLETQRRLYDLGVFARVDMALQNQQGEEPAKHVLLDMEEARKYTFTTGFGAEIAKIGGCRSCLESATGTTGFSPRASFGVTRRNFLGQGHIISFQSRASTLQQRGVLSYEAPQFRGSEHVSLLFSGVYDDSRDVRTFSSRRREVSTQVGQKLSKASTMLYRFSFRRVSVADLIVSPELIPLYSQPARIGMVAVNYIEDRRDDPSDAHRGVFNTLDAGWASKYFASQSDFTHLLVRDATYHPFGLGSRYVLARSLTFGWLQTLRAGAYLPLSERFFAGGAQSHRGFAENQAGPRDPETGFPVGGRALLVNQTELRFPALGDNVGGVLFWDAGNVYSRLQSLSLRQTQRGLDDFDYMVHAAGFGIRYRTPAGPVRLDLAWSFNPPRFFGFKGTYDELVACSSATPPTTGCLKTVQRMGHFQFHFSLGQAF